MSLRSVRDYFRDAVGLIFHSSFIGAGRLITVRNHRLPRDADEESLALSPLRSSGSRHTCTPARSYLTQLAGPCPRLEAPRRELTLSLALRETKPDA